MGIFKGARMMNYEFALEHLEATIKQWYKENVAVDKLDGVRDWFKIEITTKYKSKTLVVKDLSSPIVVKNLGIKEFTSSSIRLMYDQAFFAFPTKVKV